MSYSTEHISRILRETREKRGLSQRQLSAASGVPQSHLSKIEKGAVDLRLSSLIELARTLDLELTLVPRQAVPAVQSIVRSSEPPSAASGKEAQLALKDLNRLQQTVASNLSRLNLPPSELTQLQRQIRQLPHYSLSNFERETIRAANQTLKEYFKDTNNVNAVRQALSQVKELHNALAHGAAHHTPHPEPARPAYSLDEDENA
jgi:transcriptional regulator with XRE-family HTH domain